MENLLTAKQVAHLEANMLKGFLETLPMRERGRFATGIVHAVSVDRTIWYNWKYGKCRMPVHVKNLIEEQAHRRIFIGTEMY